MAGGSIKDIKLRIRSVESTGQITKAMELVASSKLKKARERVEQSRPYFEILQSTLKDIAANADDVTSVYLTERPVKKSLYLLIAGDRGLAGGYNSNMYKCFAAHAEGKVFRVIPVGKKAVEYCKRNNFEIITEEYMLVEDITPAECDKIAKKAAEMFAKEEIDEFCIGYTSFVTMLTQTPQVTKALPVEKQTGGKVSGYTEYEPSAKDLFDMVVPQYLTGVIYGAVAESFASELASRRNAMDSASKNAREIVDNLSLQYNRARQAAITQEITEIVGGSDIY